MKSLLIPLQKCEEIAGDFKLPGTLILASSCVADKLPLEQLKAEFANIGVEAKVSADATQGTVQLKRINAMTHQDQYSLTVNKDNIEIISSSDAGAYYALQTLRDLIRLYEKNIPCCKIDDWPGFGRRGIMIDCSRGKVPKVSTVKKLIEFLAHWKINELQLYIENTFKFEKHPAIGKGFSPFTSSDILEIREHAEMHHIQLVPTLASFGHFEKILSLPEYQHLGELPGSRGMIAGTTLCPTNPQSIDLLSDMYDEFLPLFKSNQFNICGDESHGLGEGKSKERADEIGEGPLYLEFILKIKKLCDKHNKQVNMWSDIVMKHPEIIPQIPKDIVMLNWDYVATEKRAKESDKSGNGGRAWQSFKFKELDIPFVSCPGTSTWVTHGGRLQWALDDVAYQARMATENGAQGIINTEWGNFGHRNTIGASLCSMAHSAAHSWCSSKVDDKKHVHLFCDSVFGDKDGKIANALTILGDYNPKAIDQIYTSFLECLDKPKPLTMEGHIFDGSLVERNMKVNDVKPIWQEIIQRQEIMSTLKWAEPSRSIGEFEKSILGEYALETDMHSLGCKRIDLALKLRDGQAIPKSAFLKHADDFKECAVNFEKTWLAMNRQSRLCDNMIFFELAIKEALALI